MSEFIPARPAVKAEDVAPTAPAAEAAPTSGPTIVGTPTKFSPPHVVNRPVNAEPKVKREYAYQVVARERAERNR